VVHVSRGGYVEARIHLSERRKLARLIMNSIVSVHDGKGRFVRDAALRSLLRQYHEEIDGAFIAVARMFEETRHRKKVVR
jgi:hypothetical protein